MQSIVAVAYGTNITNFTNFTLVAVVTYGTNITMRIVHTVKNYYT